MTLIFGSRHKNGDWLYEEEWDKYKEAGILTNIITAFSRDQKEKYMYNIELTRTLIWYTTISIKIMDISTYAVSEDLSKTF